MSSFKIGHGYDVHKLVEGRRLIIGGVEIPHTLGLLGHSDADVLTHAVMDALIGALGLGDIGRHFPDSSDKYKGISSLILLSEVKKILDKNNFKVINVDATVVLERPKLMPHIPVMVKNIAGVLMLDESCVNIKATTEEHLGFTGRGEGISSHAVCLIEKIRD